MNYKKYDYSCTIFSLGLKQKFIPHINEKYKGNKH